MSILLAVLNQSPTLIRIEINTRSCPGIWNWEIVSFFTLKHSIQEKGILTDRFEEEHFHLDGLVTTRFTLKDQEKHHLRFQN